MVFVSVFSSLSDCVNKLILKKAILQINHGKIYFNKNKNILSICLKCFKHTFWDSGMKRNGKYIKLVVYKVESFKIYS